MNPIRKPLVPTDFSLHATEAFRVAHELAKATGAGVVVSHASRPPAVVSHGDRLLSAPGREAEAPTHPAAAQPAARVKP
ncbi:MAG: universal stress protein [Mycobacteriaceae bacterium]|nr:universal stress protein [Mycobacteriaceae bacterium]